MQALIHKYSTFSITIFLWLVSCYTQAQSVLASGQWLKFSVTSEGIYKITGSQLSKAGLNLSTISAANLKVYGNPGGMLPQSNSVSRPDDLLELAIYVEDGGDGKFGTDDYLLFYGQGPNRADYDISKEIFNYETNLYAEKNFYFITPDGSLGKRMGQSASLPGSFPLITSFDDYAVYENDQVNILQSGREWYGERFDLNTTYDISFNIPGIVPNTSIKIVSNVMAKAYQVSTFNLSFNGTAILEQSVLPVPNTRYGEKGKEKTDTVTINSNSVLAPTSTNQVLTYRYNKSTSGESVGYLDYVLLNFSRQLNVYNGQTIFTSRNSLLNTTSTFQVGQSNNKTQIWDITDYSNPSLQQLSLTGTQVSFSTETSSLKKFIAFNKNEEHIPLFEGTVPNQNLHGLPTPNLLVVTHNQLLVEANRLAQLRESQGWSVAVVSVDQIFNEFSSGRQDVVAIRDFVKYMYDKSPSILTSLLLFGKSSYDYKNRLTNNTNFVPTYESRNSLHPLETYSSDDFFGFLENNEGEWTEGYTPENHTVDIGIGRIPVQLPVENEEATQVVNKLIAYDLNKQSLGKWRKQIVFIADDGDNNIHQDQSNKLAQLIDDNNPEFDPRKVFLDAYPQVLQPAGERAPEVNKIILESIDQGSLIINYTGHGSERQFADERIFDDVAITQLSNINYPLFVTATCEFGRHDDPYMRSSAERCLIQKEGGSIGMVSTARPVSSNTNFELNKAFYNALFLRENSIPLNLGEVFRRTKNNSISGVSNRNFSLLGDPSMTLAFPKNEIVVTSIFTSGQEDTLKALSHVTVHGKIINFNGDLLSQFNGTLQVVLFDKQNNFTTLGTESTPFNYKQWSNTLFRGKASVVNGNFQFDLVVPKNIAYPFGKGKLSLYAFDPVQLTDATGFDIDFVVGSTNNAPDDKTSPQITLYMGDITFKDGGTTSPDTKLLGQLYDEHGINITTYGIGNGLIGVLDDTTQLILNDYFECDLDDYKSGWINFPLKGLQPGKHNLIVKAWDTYNNLSEARISFIVTDGNELRIEHLGNYPNPFRDHTTMFFTHNRSGDDMEIQLTIFDITGALLRTEKLMINSCPYRVELPDFEGINDSGEKLEAGVYLARLSVRSLSNGSKNERVTKLIIVN